MDLVSESKVGVEAPMGDGAQKSHISWPVSVVYALGDSFQTGDSIGSSVVSCCGGECDLVGDTMVVDDAGAANDSVDVSTVPCRMFTCMCVISGVVDSCTNGSC